MPGRGTVPGGTVPGGTAPAGVPDADWTDQVTDLIVDSVDKVRARTTGPVLEGAKGLVYAVVALIVLVPVTILVLAGMVRLLSYWLPGGVWAAYTVMAVVFILVGVLLWRRRGASTA
jgi:hypothetical protein